MGHRKETGRKLKEGMRREEAGAEGKAKREKNTIGTGGKEQGATTRNMSRMAACRYQGARSKEQGARRSTWSFSLRSSCMLASRSFIWSRVLDKVLTASMSESFDFFHFSLNVSNSWNKIN